MVEVVYRLKAAPGKAPAAMRWAKKHLDYAKQAGLCAPAVFLLQPRTGQTDEVVWVDRFTNISMYEEYWDGKAKADSGWQKNMKELMQSDWYRGMEVQIYDVVEVVQ